ncbi:MAG: outer membrane protein assembly factor BamB [Planctomycetota bacterium]|jgi:outer membrane protein assembly factor BamB
MSNATIGSPETLRPWLCLVATALLFGYAPAVFGYAPAVFGYAPAVFGYAPAAQQVEEPAPPVATWAQWRGPLGTGVAPDATPPLEWSETENLHWRVALPGKGHATPVVAGGLLFMTATHPIGERTEPRPETAPGAHNNVFVDQAHRFLAFAVDQTSGEIVWQTTLAERFPFEGGHSSGTYASGSPVTDGERFYASFGSAGVFCLDMGGQVLWKTEPEQLQSKHGHGEGSSPALFGDSLFVNADHEGQSYLVALDKLTGKERWRVVRDEVTSWTSPIVVELSDGPQLIVCGTKYVRAYNPENGEVIWRCPGLSHNVVATPVFGHGMLFAASSYEKQALLALRLEGAKGDLEETDHVVWYHRRTAPYVPSPLLYGNALYILNHYQGIVSRYDAKTGEREGKPTRLSGINDVYASPLGAAGRIYIVDRSGETVVISHADEPQVLARNMLNDSFSASPIAIGSDLFLRGEAFLYCLRDDG